MIHRSVSTVSNTITEVNLPEAEINDRERSFCSEASIDKGVVIACELDVLYCEIYNRAIRTKNVSSKAFGVHYIGEKACKASSRF